MLDRMIRAPAVAGHFYPADARELRAMAQRFMESDEGERRRAKAVLVPHAGYMYSGKTAGIVYRSVELPCRFLLLGPNHTGLGTSLSVYPPGAWETPLGRVAMDDDLASALLAACPSARFDSVAHLREHSLEVQVPFLQTARGGDFRATAVVVGTGDYARLEQLGEAVAEAVRASEEPVLLVVSSDMTHYEEAESARRKDRHALEALAAIEPRDLHHAVRREDISMCGYAPAVAALVALRALGARGGEVLDYTNSGDATGDYRSVVAYAGMRFA